MKMLGGETKREGGVRKNERMRGGCFVGGVCCLMMKKEKEREGRERIYIPNFLLLIIFLLSLLFLFLSHYSRNIIKVRNLGQKRGVIPHRDYSSLVREQQQFSQKVAQEDDDLDDDDDEEGGEQGGGRWGEDDEEDDEEVDLMGKAGKAEAKEEGRKRKRADDSGRNVRRKY